MNNWNKTGQKLVRVKMPDKRNIYNSLIIGARSRNRTGMGD